MVSRMKHSLLLLAAVLLVTAPPLAARVAKAMTTLLILGSKPDPALPPRSA